MARGELNDMGPTAVLDTGKVEIVVISRHVEPHDLAAFTAVGIEPETKRFVMLKSRIHWRAGLRAAGARGRRMRRHGRLHLGLRDAELQERAPADLSARRLTPLPLARHGGEVG